MASQAFLVAAWGSSEIVGGGAADGTIDMVTLMILGACLMSKGRPGCFIVRDGVSSRDKLHGSSAAPFLFHPRVCDIGLGGGTVPAFLRARSAR